MGRVNVSDFSLQVAEEATPGVLPGSPVWFGLKPTAINAFGNDDKTKTPRSISKDRQAEKPVVIDRDTEVAFDHDLALDVIQRFAEAFVFAQAANWNLAFRAANVDLTGSAGYVIPAATAAQAGKLQFTASKATLLWASGYANAANNGLKTLTTDVASTDTKMICAGQGLVTETAPTNARVEVCGIRPASGDLSISVSAGVATVTSAAALDFTTAGIFVGQRVHVGGLTTTNQFNAGAGTMLVTSLTATTLVGRLLSGTLATDAGTGKVIDLLYGQLIRNVAVDDNADDRRYLSRTLQFEGSYPNLGTGGATEYEYGIGCYANEFALNAPLADFVQATLGFFPITVEAITGTRKTNAATPVSPLQRKQFSTATDYAGLFARDSLNNELGTCFKSWSLTLGNGVNAEKCQGTLGATFINVGNLSVGFEAQTLFTNKEVTNAIRSNRTVSFSAVLRNTDGAVAVDVPSMVFAGGGKEFPLEQSVLVNVTGTAFRDDVLGYSIGISTFPAYPAAA